MRSRGYVWIPEDYKKRKVIGTEPELRQGRIVCSYAGTDKATGRPYGQKIKIESASPAEWKKQGYLNLFGKPRIINKMEHRREIEYRKFLKGKWEEITRSTSYRVGSGWWYWWR